MAAKIRLELNHAGFAAIGQSAEMAALLQTTDDGVAAQCGDGYSVEVKRSKYQDGRLVAVVMPTTADAIRDEAENKTLEKAVNG